MAWQLSDGTTTVTLRVTAGEIVVLHPKTVSVMWPLRGTTPYVQAGPSRAPQIELPALLAIGTTEWEQLTALLTSGLNLTLTDDIGSGGTWTVRPAGEVESRIEDTPDRGTNPRYRVTVKLVTVA